MGFTAKNISKTFSGRQNDLIAIKDLNFSINDGEFVCIVGPSGCGKSTLLRLIADLIKPTSGEIIFNKTLPPKQLRTAIIFQDLGLFPWMNVLDNVAFGLEALGINKETRHMRAFNFLERVGLTDFAKSYPHELSGGMRQRVAILRAFLSDAPILLMDEPFSALDSQMRLVMQEELLRIWKEFRQTVVYVTHDIEEAILLGDRVLVMTGRPAAIRADISIPLERPRHLTDKSHPEIVDLRFQIWEMLKEEVYKELAVSSP